MKTLPNGLLLSILATWMLSGCVTTQSAYLTRADTNDIEVYMTTLPDKEYTEWAYLEASGSIFHSNKALLRKLKQKAVEEGADALINVSFGYIPWALGGIPVARGVAIRYR